MKNLVRLFLIVIIGVLAGCSPFYGNVKQYEKGDWYFLSSPSEVARTQEQKMAINKLENQEVETLTINGVPQGYKGIVVNLDCYRRINIHIIGVATEKQKFFLSPGEQQFVYLLPGKYCAYAYKGNRLVGTWSFEVGVQMNSFMGQKVHWYVYYDPRM